MTPQFFTSARSCLLRALALGFGLLAGAAHAEGTWFERAGAGAMAGSGKVASEHRTVGSFQAVDLKGSMRLVLRQAGQEGVEVSADDNLLPLVDTTVVDRGGVPTLEIGMRRDASYSTRHRMVVTVDVVTLKSLTLSGSGDAQATGLKTGELQVKVIGSGDLQLRQLSADTVAVKVMGSGDVAATGHAGKLSVSIAGSGDVMARELQADDVSVSIAGSGDAGVNARKTLSVSIAGSGDVAYTGEASVKTSIAGSGSVTRH